MRLLSVIHNPVYGGAHNELLRQRAGLAEHGWDTLALTVEGGGAERLREAGVPVITMPLHRLRDPREVGENLRLLLRAPRELRALRSVIRRERIDLVQAHGVINPHAAMAARREGAAVCWHLYDMVAPEPLRRALSPLVVRWADSATSIGRALVRAHPGVERLGERLIVTSPPVDLDEFTPRPPARSDVVTVGMVGNLFPNKAHLDLLEAMAPLLGPRVRLRLVGSASPAHPEHHAAVAARARELGVPLEEIDSVAGVLSELDLFVMPSHSEGMPTTVIEAMACGVAVVATDVGAVSELVVDGETGLLCRPRDPADLRRAIASLVPDAERRRAMGTAGRARVKEEFGLERVIERRLRAYAVATAYAASRPRS